MHKLLTLLGRVSFALGTVVLVAHLWRAWYLTPGLRHGSPTALALAAGLLSVALAVAGWAFSPRRRSGWWPGAYVSVADWVGCVGLCWRGW